MSLLGSTCTVFSTTLEEEVLISHIVSESGGSALAKPTETFFIERLAEKCGDFVILELSLPLFYRNAKKRYVLVTGGQVWAVYRRVYEKDPSKHFDMSEWVANLLKQHAVEAAITEEETPADLAAYMKRLFARE